MMHQATVHQHIEAILPQIQRPATGCIRQPVLTVAYSQHYAGCFFPWNHHHMALRLAYAGRPEYLRYQTDNVLAHQAADGFAPSGFGPASDPAALRRHGFSTEARDVADHTTRLLAAALERIGSFTENYDAETGAPLSAQGFASWNILADKLHEELDGRAWIMQPLFE